jgi:signal transduction histidine kinase
MRRPLSYKSSVEHGVGRMHAAGRLQSDLFLDLAASLDARDVIERVLRRGLNETRSDRATLSRLEPDALVIEATLGLDGDVSWRGRSYPLSTIETQPTVQRCLSELRTVFGGTLDVAAAEPEFRPALTEVHNTAAIPLVHGGQAVGLLVLSRYSEQAYDDNDRAALDSLSMAAGLALRNALVFSELEEKRAELSSALAAAADLSNQTDLSGVLERLVARAMEAAHADGGSLGTPDGDELVIEAVAPVASPGDGAGIVGSRWPLHPRTREGIADGRPVTLTATEYLSAPDGMAEITESYRHFLVVPLRLQGEPTALIALGRRRDEPFTDADADRILHFGTLAAMRLRNVRLLERSIGAERSRAEFMNAAVHEMRSPLTVISGYLDMALADNFGPLPDGLRKVLSTINRKSDELKRTVEELLTLARLESGVIVSSGDTVDVVQLAREAVERAEARVKLLGGEVEMTTPVDSATASGDAQLIPRVLDNLINNAVTYSGDQPRVRVSVSAVDGRVDVDVADSGPGVPADEQERIFQKFQRGSTARSARTEGSGLGLYLSRGFADRMGGTLTLARSDESGSTFRLTLPR